MIFILTSGTKNVHLLRTSLELISFKQDECERKLFPF